jgi:hypothetical protein
LKRKDKIEEQPDVDFRPSERKGIRLTNEVRAEVVALTGHDIAADDPVMVLVVLNQILLPRIAEQVAETIRAANVDTAEALAEMRTETLKSVAGDLLLLAGQARDTLRVDLAETSARAAAIVAGLETSIKVSRGFWVIVGAIGCGLLVLGIAIGVGLGK